MKRILSALVASVLLVLSACGDSTSRSNGPSTTAPASTSPASSVVVATFPVQVPNNGGTLTIKAKPTHIVSLSPTATEMLFAIGAGPQVIAVDDQSNYPAAAPKTDLSGFKPNVEAIASRKPDLVVAQGDSNGMIAALQNLSIPVLVQTAAKNLDETYAEIEQLGLATGNPAGAADVVRSMRARVETLLKTLPKPAVPLKVYHELDPTFFTATSSTFIGALYKMLGLDNIADAADKSGSGYPQLSAEYIVKADPDLILLGDTKCCNESIKTVAARPGFANLRAVKNGAVVELDDDIASRWGPRTPDLLEAVANAIAKLPVAAAR